MKINERIITDRQLKYVNILLTQLVGEHFRKDYLRHFYKIESSKNLTFNQAHEIIEKFCPDNPSRDLNGSQVVAKINELRGQTKLF